MKKTEDSLAMPQGRSSKPAHLLLGESGEALAARILLKKGYNILARNWRCGRLEIDIICQDDEVIVFVEVKTRRSHAYGGGAGAITINKRRRLARGAQIWLLRNNACGSPCRFDVICLTGSGESFQLEHYQNAFEFSPSLDCGDFAWQSS